MHDKPTGDDLKNLPLAVEGGKLTMNVEVEEDLPQSCQTCTVAVLLLQIPHA